MFQYCHGVDLVDRNKFREIFARHAGLLEDVFTEQERQDCQSRSDPWKHFAGRFAAKEACLKALQLGFFGLGIDHRLVEIEILAQSAGRWGLVSHDWMARIARVTRVLRWEISISYTRNYAIAAAVLVAQPSSGAETSGLL